MPKPKEKIKDYWVCFRPIGYGCGQAELWMPGWSAPVGVVWYHNFYTKNSGQRIEIMNSYTVEGARRIGVRTAIHQEMLKRYGKCIITTGDKSEAKGVAWMKKTGYKLNKESSQWILRHVPKKPRG